MREPGRNARIVERARRDGSRRRALLAARGGAGHGPNGLGPERQLIDRVLGLDEERLAALVAEDALDRRRHHAMAVGISKDHHSATDARIGDEVASVSSTDAERCALAAVIADLAGGDTDHGRIPIKGW